MRTYFLLLVIAITWTFEVNGQVFLNPIGSPCHSTEECVKNSDCVYETCQCKSGFTVLSSLECRMDYDGICSQDSDCNNPMGLHCVDSLCKCSEHLGEAYVPTLGACVNSTTKIMYEDIVNLINKTEFELSRFTTLLSIFMIHSNTNQTETSASEINPVVYQSLLSLEHQLEAEQNPIPSIVSPPENNEIIQDQEARAQVESPQTVVPPASSPGGSLPSLPTQLPNSINSLLNVPILPNQGGQSQNAFSFPGTNLGGGNQGEALTNVLPNFLQMFKQFLPILQGYNNVLSSSVLQQGSQNRQGGDAGGLGGALGGLGGLFGGGGGNPLSGLVGLINVPVRIIQIPGRIFNSFFGHNSTIGMIKRRIIPIDFSDRPIQLLPWPLG